MYACQSRNIELVKFLKEYVNDIPSFRHWGLIGACEGGHLELVNMMLELGAQNYYEAIFYACKGGNIDIINIIFNSGVNDYNRGLYGACEGGHIEVVKMMILLGANNYNEGLRRACSYKHIEIAKLMISLGANKYQFLYIDNLEFNILYIRLTSKVVILHIKTEHPEYHLLNVYNKRIPDIDRLINKYLY